MPASFKIRCKIRSVLFPLRLCNIHIIIRCMHRIFYRLNIFPRIIIQCVAFLFTAIHLFRSAFSCACGRADKLRALEHDRLIGRRPEFGYFIIISVQLKKKAPGYIHAAGRILRYIDVIIGNLIGFALKRYASARNPVHILTHMLFQRILADGLSVCFFCRCNRIRRILRKIFPVKNINAAFLHADISHKLIISGVLTI